MSALWEPADGGEPDDPREMGPPDAGARREPPAYELLPATPEPSADDQGDAVRSQPRTSDEDTQGFRAQEALRAERERGRAGYTVHSMHIGAERAAGRDYHEQHVHAARAAGGDYYEQHFYAGTRRTAGPGAVSTDDLKALCDVYVTTVADSELRKRLVARRLVVLNGRRDSGRHATALFALDQMTGRDRAAARVAVLPSPTSLADLPDDQLVEGRGHLVDMSGRHEPGRDQEATIGRLRKRLGDAEAYLVVLSDDPSPSRALLDQTHRHEAPNLRDVLLAHLPAYVSGSAPVDAARLLADAEKHPRVSELLGVMRTPEEAVELASVIGAWTGAREADPAAEPDVRSSRYTWLRRHAQRLLRDVERDHTPLHQAFALAAGVLDGAPLAQVTEVAEDLANRLGAVERPGVVAGGRPVFTDPLTERLTYAEVGGSGRGPVVRLHDPALTGVLLDVVWNEYDAARRCVLDWLKALCDSPEPVRQARGALAIARLAAFDFRQIKRDVLDPWSGQQRKRPLQVSAWILEALYLSGDDRGQVRRLVHKWARAGRWQRRAVAVRALGTLVGAEQPEDALEAIADASEKDVTHTRSYARNVENALVELYDLGQREPVLEALHKWLDRPALYERTAATFVRLCRKTTPEKAPELLDAMADARAPLSIEQFSDLWRHTLSSPVSGERAWYWLRAWLDYAYHHPDAVREIFDLLLMEITKDPVLRVRLDRHRRFWRLHDAARARRPTPAEPDDPADDDDFDDFDDLDDPDDVDDPAGDERRPLILEETTHE